MTKMSRAKSNEFNVLIINNRFRFVILAGGAVAALTRRVEEFAQSYPQAGGRAGG
jgi:hypothetical protein